MRIAIPVLAALLAACGADPPPLGNSPADAVPAPNAPPPPAASDQAPSPAPPTPPRTVEGIGACRVQDGTALPASVLRAIGTEPFWGARIEGRCVTYSHPEDQAGTRIWTRFSGTAEAGVWTGFYMNQEFVLRTRAQAGCSDGMSDKRYPIAVELTVAGEERTGCAEPL